MGGTFADKRKVGRTPGGIIENSSYRMNNLVRAIFFLPFEAVVADKRLHNHTYL